MLSILYALMTMCGKTDEFETRWNGYLNFAPHRTNEQDFVYSVHVTFVNEASLPVNIYKVSSFAKQLTSSGLVESTIVPGGKSKISCAAGDTFIARIHAPGHHDDERMLLAHDVSLVHISNETCPDALQNVEGSTHEPQGALSMTRKSGTSKFVRCQRKEFTSDMRWTPPDSLLFKNHMLADANMFYVDEHAGCEEFVGKIAPLQTHHMQSSLGHLFHVRGDDNHFVQKYRLEEVPIRDLSDEDYDVSERASELFDRVQLQTLQKSLQAHSELIEKLTERVSLRKDSANLVSVEGCA